MMGSRSQAGTDGGMSSLLLYKRLDHVINIIPLGFNVFIFMNHYKSNVTFFFQLQVQLNQKHADLFTFCVKKSTSLG